MPFLFIVIALAVLAAVALVAAGRGDTLAEASVDEPPVELPARRLSARDLDTVRFPIAFRGYRMDRVDAVLDRLRHELAERDDRIAELERTAPDRSRADRS